MRVAALLAWLAFCLTGGGCARQPSGLPGTLQASLEGAKPPAFVLEQALSGRGFAVTFESLRPRHPQYGLLKQALQREREIAAQGGSPTNLPPKRGRSRARARPCPCSSASARSS